MLSDIWVYTRTAKLMIGLLLLAALLLATQNWPLGLLFFIIVAGVIVYVKRSDYGQEKKLLRYLDDLSSGVSAGTVYAVKNLPVGIAMMDEKKELVWANNVFRGWLGEGAEVGVRFQDLITGQKISKIWGKTGWFECHAGESFFRVFYKFLDTGEKNDTHFMVFYFMDRTDVEKAVKACDEARAGLLPHPYRQCAGGHRRPHRCRALGPALGCHGEGPLLLQCERGLHQAVLDE